MNSEQKFIEELYKRYERTQKCLLPKEKYHSIVRELKQAQSGREKKTIRQYKLLARYEILQCGLMDKLIRKRKSPEESPIFYVTIEDTYDVIKTAHIATGHGGRDRMVKELEKNFANVLRDSVELFKSYCLVCQDKTKRKRTNGVALVCPEKTKQRRTKGGVQPILSGEFSSRGQVDLIDFQSMEDEQYKWIMVYQDHLTKFVVLRPLTSKQASEVALQLVDIFTLLGAPVIIQSDNGSEFTAAIIKELQEIWPELKIIHGKPCHPQSLGSAKRASSDIKDMLMAWMTDNQTTCWSVGLRFVQFAKNRAYNAAIKKSPYLAMFGVEPRVGLGSTSLPVELIDCFQTEDDLPTFVSSNESQTEDDLLAIAGSNETPLTEPTSPSTGVLPTERAGPNAPAILN